MKYTKRRLNNFNVHAKHLGVADHLAQRHPYEAHVLHRVDALPKLIVADLIPARVRNVQLPVLPRHEVGSLCWIGVDVEVDDTSEVRVHLRLAYGRSA